MPVSTVVNDISLATLLGINPQPFFIIVGKPSKKTSKSMRVKKFVKRVQRAK